MELPSTETDVPVEVPTTGDRYAMDDMEILAKRRRDARLNDLSNFAGWDAVEPTDEEIAKELARPRR